jgi:hypothetical protein
MQPNHERAAHHPRMTGASQARSAFLTVARDEQPQPEVSGAQAPRSLRDRRQRRRQLHQC